jgi:hypothetical protein
MNKLIIKESVERDVTPTSFPHYRKEDGFEIFYCIMPDIIVKCYCSSLPNYASITCGNYDTLGMSAAKGTIECSSNEFHDCYAKALHRINSYLQSSSNTNLITNEGDE